MSSEGPHISTSLDKAMPSADEKTAQRNKEWMELGAFVPEDLRSQADKIFAVTNTNLHFFEDLSEEKKVSCVQLFNEYKLAEAMPFHKIEDAKAQMGEKRRIEAAVQKLLG